jgi:gamma-glutamylcyclotransferase
MFTMDCWYFAYGSNLWKPQMIKRTSALSRPEHAPRVADLANHRLVFHLLQGDDQPYANILSPGAGVLGVVYRCNPADMERLDDYETGYDRHMVSVIDQQGEVLEAVVYVMQPALVIGTDRPTAEYLRRIVDGARQHGLPRQYIDSIVAIAHSPE